MGLFMATAHCSEPELTIVQKPIQMNDTRTALTLDYLKQRYGIEQQEPTITPTMVVVHWTVIPTLEQTFAAFDPAELPAARDGIRSGGQLNVSSQFVIDRDGTIYQLLPETYMARHTIGLNYTAIGIENIADGNGLPMTDAQLSANARLIRHLAGKYPIEFVLGHSEYQTFKGTRWWKEHDANYITEKNDPDPAFMQRLRGQLTDLALKPLP
jgi:N-acetyl-anhydromuramyl-L-alanine amidase AmpD|tara:strand:- start:1209 stop:1844 length:636 start_codon:yes stop_codon:yes gene_type:complete